jgi:acyl carrier protein
MDREKIIAGVFRVFKKVLGITLQAGQEYNARDIAGWDSLNHVILIRELEKEFNLEIDLFEALELTGIRPIIGFIEMKSRLHDPS